MRLKSSNKEFVDYLKSIGINVHTNTKARGNKGFYVKNRIDISKTVDNERFFDTLAHEFAHHIHSKIEPDFSKKGSLEKIFDTDYTKDIEKELIEVTKFVDENSRLEKLFFIKDEYKRRIKQKEDIIKMTCPDFQRSKPYKPFEKAIKKTKAKYLLKYDRVKFITPFLRKIEYYSIDTAEKDFPELKKEYIEILKLKSLQRKQANNSRRINHYQKYYNSPCELFARFVQCLVYDRETAQRLAPKTYERFFELLEKGFYMELDYLFI